MVLTVYGGQTVKMTSKFTDGDFMEVPSLFQLRVVNLRESAFLTLVGRNSKTKNCARPLKSIHSVQNYLSVLAI